MAGEILWEDALEILWEDGTAILWEDAGGSGGGDGGEGEGSGEEGEFPQFITEDGQGFVNEDGTTPIVDEVATVVGVGVGPITCYRSISTVTCYFYRRW